MRIKVIACETLFREIHLAAANSPHICDVKFLPRECHDDLPLMRRMLEEEMSDTNTHCASVKRGVCCSACGNTSYDSVVLAMGLCGNTTLGLAAPCVPLVLPKVHDCGGLLLGGNRHYLREEPRTVFYHQGAVERLGAGVVDAIPKKCGLGRSLQEYIRDYGEENGQYIYEMEHHFVAYNERALVLNHANLPSGPRCHQEVSEYVRKFGWRVDCLPVNMGMFHRLLSGAWNEDEFLIVQPGETVKLHVELGGAIFHA